MLYDIARYLFYLLSLWGLVYYTFQLRFIDFFTLSFFSAVIYFIPGYSGLVINPYDTDETVPLYEKCYWVYDVVLLGNLLSVVLYDYFFQDKAIVFYIPRNEHIAFWSCAIALIGFGMSLWRFPELYFDRENISKGQLQEILSHQADRWNIMWSMGAMFLALVAFEGRYKIYLGCAIVLLLSDMLLGGNRSSSVFTLIAGLCITMARKKYVLARYFRTTTHLLKGFILLFFFMSFFVLKLLLPLIQANRLDLFSEIYPSWTDILFHAFVVGEPAGIQANLAETLRLGIETDFYHPVDIVSQLIVGGDWLGMSTSSHYLTQKDIFPDLEYGIAYNIWGDVWASGGWIMLVFFVIFYHIMIVLGCLVFKKTQGFAMICTAIFFTIWAFYIHRNNLFFQIYLQKRVVLFALVVLVLSWFSAGVVGQVNSKISKPL